MERDLNASESGGTRASFSEFECTQMTALDLCTSCQFFLAPPEIKPGHPDLESLPPQLRLQVGRVS